MSTDEEKSATARAFYTRTEELIHALTHGAGAALSLAALIYFIAAYYTAGPARIAALTTYGATLLVAYTSSTLYHAWHPNDLKGFFRKLDHASIYLLIAGTYTPFTILALKPHWGWPLFGIVWALAVIGTIRKLVDVGSGSWVDVALYLSMGWIAVVAIQPLYANLSGGAFAFLVAGGLTYTLGTIFYVWERIPYNHAIWHLFVLGGSAFHFVSVVLSVGY